MGNLDTTNMRIHWLQYDTFLNIKVATSATTEVLKGLIEAQSGVPASEQRLICNQCELLPRTTLEEQSLKTNSVATLLEQPEERVCPEWLATGRCHMKGCCLRATHTKAYSRRRAIHPYALPFSCSICGPAADAPFAPKLVSSSRTFHSTEISNDIPRTNPRFHLIITHSGTFPLTV